MMSLKKRFKLQMDTALVWLVEYLLETLDKATETVKT
jgi:hypothetical protein